MLVRRFEEMRNHVHRFLEFLAESDDIMRRLNGGQYGSLDHLKRLVHTLKGNAAISEGTTQSISLPS